MLPGGDERDCLSFAQAQQAKFHNEYRKSRDFNPGDLVLLRRSPMRKNPKLEPCWIGPIQVEFKHSLVTYRLKLPPGSRMHPVVYVGWLRPYYTSNALAAAPDYKKNSADSTNFFEYQFPLKILPLADVPLFSSSYTLHPDHPAINPVLCLLHNLTPDLFPLTSPVHHSRIPVFH